MTPVVRPVVPHDVDLELELVGAVARERTCRAALADPELYWAPQHARLVAALIDADVLAEYGTDERGHLVWVFDGLDTELVDLATAAVECTPGPLPWLVARLQELAHRRAVMRSAAMAYEAARDGVPLDEITWEAA